MEPLIRFDDAFTRIRTHMPNWGFETVPAEEAYGRIAASDVEAEMDVPPFSRSMMDGYAVMAEDLSRGTTLQVISTVAAGQPAKSTIEKGQAVRVMTGAPVPENAAGVVRDEWCQVLDEARIEVLRTVFVGESIQSKGDDGKPGQKLVAQGTRFTELDVAVLKAFGVTQVSVYRMPSAALIITGTELVEDVTDELQFGQIYGTNDALLKGALESDGICVGLVEYVQDDAEKLTNAVKRASDAHDLVIVTGGVSVGDFDFTPSAIEGAGSTVHIRKVLMRPGSPFVFATAESTALFGLSGNPGACFAQFSVLVRPAIRLALGLNDAPFPHSGILSHDISLKPIKHTRVQRAKVYVESGQLLVDCQLSQSSGVISSFVSTDAYVRLDDSTLKNGTVVPLRFVRNLPGC
ncbi:molybdopterin molybdotransferase MoeA [Alicyclobacillus mengziensis]|uniref:Molybdopterin molybdenumtransferase n=1 Tax=Alicyclobacillus mengziensis TaxID=2931921 RepID=A0A9X7Z6B7_9BACL|nr:molybdopterin molybdotransferase MoeA [Alicyclobacillus mengziensis]QSO46186.1 molybdopterin molybdotransferase MoeA [Alicyclobacillus mengziensis]